MSEDQTTQQWISDDKRKQVQLTYDPIDVFSLYNACKSPQAGAVVIFSGCTRDNSVPEGEYVENTTTNAESMGAHTHTIVNGTATHDSKKPSSLPVASLTYSSYIPLAMKTLRSIAERIHTLHKLERIAVTHRLGTVPLGEESVVLCVSAGHRQEAWRAGEEALEEVKRRVEIWKWEVFQGGGQNSETAVWRSNQTDNKIRAQQHGA